MRSGNIVEFEELYLYEYIWFTAIDIDDDHNPIQRQGIIKVIDKNKNKKLVIKRISGPPKYAATIDEEEYKLPVGVKLSQNEEL